MIIAIMYPSSAEFWLNAAKGINFRMFSTENRRFAELPADLGRRPAASEIRAVAERCSLSLPVHVMTDSKIYQNSCKSSVYHLRPHVLPPHSFLYMGTTYVGKEEVSVYVSGPEFTFLQAASRLPKQSWKLPYADIINLIVFGTELCGMYVYDSAEKYSHQRRDQIATAESIREYLDIAEGAYGIQKARRAVQYILNKSNSPRETMLSVCMTLPPSAGGYGIPKPELNREIKNVYSNMLMRCDMVWLDACTVAEYDSDQTHLDARQHALDCERQNMLVSSGYKTVHLTTAILKDFSKREEVFSSLRHYLNLRNEGRMEQYVDRRRRLWHMLNNTPVYDLFIRK